MLRAWTRRGQIQMIDELSVLMTQAECLASQERATGRSVGLASAIRPLVERSRAELARLECELVAGASPKDTRGDLSTLYRLVAREVDRADRALKERLS